ncbi:hypothetical protein BCR39DRAFT_505947 [Naematelia encephala]|uniref:Uncharacterized protein n=1 Tax=Naematelia encephala TaxID=71784 RepID=A0A1Y2AZV9_9TREE|nr:hypothetical protein BCR39DRAFT_505947 [Naematelia encephala]
MSDDNSNAQSGSSGLSTGAEVGIAVAAVAVILLLGSYILHRKGYISQRCRECREKFLPEMMKNGQKRFLLWTSHVWRHSETLKILTTPERSVRMKGSIGDAG